MENGTSWREGSVTRTILEFRVEDQKYLVHTEKMKPPNPDPLWLSRENVERRLGDSLARGLGLNNMNPARNPRFLPKNANWNSDDETI